MSTVSRSPREHYAEATRLLGVAESPAVDPGLRDLSAALALAHAVLTLSPRRARRAPKPPGRHADLPRTLSWGDDEDDQR